MIQICLPFGQVWVETRDGDQSVRTVFDRHYSRRRYADGRRPSIYVGPGEKIVLRTESGDAICIWRKFLSMDHQKGVNCAVFRNESKRLSSDLILEAEGSAWERWPGSRFYTYVNPNKIRSTNPGYCFLMAGWRKAGVTKGGLHILDKFPGC